MMSGDKPMALPAVNEEALADASMVTIHLSPNKPAMGMVGAAPRPSKLKSDGSARTNRESAEQHMSVPAIMPISPLDEREVKAAHSHLRRKVRNRVVPWLFVIVLLVAMCGRNQGVAALTMAPRLGFSDAQYGFGSSIFYAGAIATQLPSIWLARRIGVPALLFAVLIVWSVATALFALLPYVPSGSPITPFDCFCALRVVLGAAEGALVPTMYHYLTLWYGALPDNLASLYGQVTIGSQVAGVIGTVVAAKLLLLDGVGHLDGWQWIFIVEAAPLLFAALATPLLLTRDPEHARWLDMDEKKMLAEQRVSTGPDGFRQTAINTHDSSAAAFDDEHVAKQRAVQARARATVGDEKSTSSVYDAAKMTALVLTDRAVAYLSLCVLLLQITLWSLLYWQPLLIQSRMPADSSDYTVAIISALPHLCGVCGTLALGQSANTVRCDRRQRELDDMVSRTERRWHSSIAMVAGGAALSLATFSLGTKSFILPLVLLCTANGCLWAVGGLLSTWPNVWLSKGAAVVALAVLNMASAVGGLVGPALVGFLTPVLADNRNAKPMAGSDESEWLSGADTLSRDMAGDLASGASEEHDSVAVSLHTAVGVLGGCAIAAGMLAACFRPKAKVPPPPTNHQAEGTSECNWRPEVSVIVG